VFGELVHLGLRTAAEGASSRWVAIVWMDFVISHPLKGNVSDVNDASEGSV
jgi:hypothetical protein